MAGWHCSSIPLPMWGMFLCLVSPSPQRVGETGWHCCRQGSLHSTTYTVHGRQRSTTSGRPEHRGVLVAVAICERCTKYSVSPRSRQSMAVAFTSPRCR
ncbi:hypothetical protein LZ30DRAFT_89111 [Colletotrichum cereale]|nr:hypothetical protein LZ30DRAFT_89111 [Colletotrichum cereale]